MEGIDYFLMHSIKNFSRFLHRSMLYNGSDVIRDLEWVIFDEVHYINDAEVCCLPQVSSAKILNFFKQQS